MTILLALLGMTSLSFAGHDCQDCPESKDAKHHEKSERHWKWGRWSAGAGGGFTARLTGVDTGRFSSAFTDNGFQAPAKTNVGWGGHGYVLTKTGWRFGGAGFRVSGEREAGTSKASYKIGYGGFLVGYDFLAGRNLGLSLGSVIGWGSARVHVLSTIRAGEFEEDYFAAAPELELSYRVARWLKAGVVAAYFLPLAQSSEIRGTNLGLTRIAASAWTTGAQFTFGSFGGADEEKVPGENAGE